MESYAKPVVRVAAALSCAALLVSCAGPERQQAADWRSRLAATPEGRRFEVVAALVAEAPDPVAVLGAALREPSPPVAIIWAAGTLGSPAGALLPTLERLRGTVDDPGRDLVIGYAQRRVGGARTGNTLVDTLEHGSEADRRSLLDPVWLSGGAADRYAVPAVLVYLVADEPELRRGACAVLGAIGRDIPWVAPAVASRLDDPEPTVRAAARAALRALGAADEPLPRLQLEQVTDPVARPNPGLIAALIADLDSPREDVRYQAVQRLATYQEQAAAAAPRLAELIADSTEAMYVRRTAFAALYKIDRTVWEQHRDALGP